MKKAFVTGGSGHVGANLVRQLLEKGWTVRCLVHKDTRALENLDVECVQGNIINPGQLTPKLKGIDTVFHCAAYVAVESVDIPLMETINIKGTEAICEASISAGVERLIHFSSIHAFQQNPTYTALTKKHHFQDQVLILEKYHQVNEQNVCSHHLFFQVIFHDQLRPNLVQIYCM